MGLADKLPTVQLPDHPSPRHPPPSDHSPAASPSANPSPSSLRPGLATGRGVGIVPLPKFPSRLDRTPGDASGASRHINRTHSAPPQELSDVCVERPLEPPAVPSVRSPSSSSVLKPPAGAAFRARKDGGSARPQRTSSGGNAVMRMAKIRRDGDENGAAEMYEAEEVVGTGGGCAGPAEGVCGVGVVPWIGCMGAVASTGACAERHVHVQQRVVPALCHRPNPSTPSSSPLPRASLPRHTPSQSFRFPLCVLCRVLSVFPPSLAARPPHPPWRPLSPLPRAPPHQAEDYDSTKASAHPPAPPSSSALDSPSAHSTGRAGPPADVECRDGWGEDGEREGEAVHGEGEQGRSPPRMDVLLSRFEAGTQQLGTLLWGNESSPLADIHPPSPPPKAATPAAASPPQRAPVFPSSSSVACSPPKPPHPAPDTKAAIRLRFAGDRARGAAGLLFMGKASRRTLSVSSHASSCSVLTLSSTASAPPAPDPESPAVEQGAVRVRHMHTASRASIANSLFDDPMLDAIYADDDADPDHPDPDQDRSEDGWAARGDSIAEGRTSSIHLGSGRLGSMRYGEGAEEEWGVEVEREASSMRALVQQIADRGGLEDCLASYAGMRMEVVRRAVKEADVQLAVSAGALEGQAWGAVEPMFKTWLSQAHSLVSPLPPLPSYRINPLTLTAMHAHSDQRAHMHSVGQRYRRVHAGMESIPQQLPSTALVLVQRERALLAAIFKDIPSFALSAPPGPAKPALARLPSLAAKLPTPTALLADIMVEAGLLTALFHLRASATALLHTAPAPEKIFVLLDMYWLLRSTTDNMREVAPASLAEAWGALPRRAAEAATKSLAELQAMVEQGCRAPPATTTKKSLGARLRLPRPGRKKAQEAQEGAPSSVAVHPVTSYVVNYLQQFQDRSHAGSYGCILEEALREFEEGASVERETGRLLEGVQANMEVKGRACPTDITCTIFLINNLHYLASFAEKNEHPCAGALSAVLEKHTDAFVSLALKRILDALGPGDSSSIDDNEVIKRLRVFNAAFEELALEQKDWSFTNDDCRRNMRQRLASTVRTTYAKFLLPHREDLCTMPTYHWAPDGVERLMQKSFLFNSSLLPFSASL
ncbi:unnamed protein product [Closterium sp. NIES-64]|nr:unnamed protein product [Closterium sp. NIES-64]